MYTASPSCVPPSQRGSLLAAHVGDLRFLRQLVLTFWEDARRINENSTRSGNQIMWALKESLDLTFQGHQSHTARRHGPRRHEWFMQPKALKYRGKAWKEARGAISAKCLLQPGASHEPSGNCDFLRLLRHRKTERERERDEFMSFLHYSPPIVSAYCMEEQTDHFSSAACANSEKENIYRLPGLISAWVCSVRVCLFLLVGN